jgi:prolyl-tRNA synthetase
MGLINLRPSDDKCRTAADDLYAKLRGAGIEVLYDDRDESPGAKFAAMDLIGLPDQLILGPRGLAAGTIEWKNRRSGAREDLPLDDAVQGFADKPLSRTAGEGGAHAAGVGG